MKTRLLKRLRKKAKKRYWIEYDPEDIYGEFYRIFDLYHYRHRYGIWIKASCRDLESAKRECESLRREYILGMIEEMRPEDHKRIY